MFWLEPHPTDGVPRRGSPRMFRVEWIERYLSRVRPVHVVVVWLPVTAYLLWSSGVALGLARTVPLALLGVLAWTLLEYALHRWVFHFVPRSGSELQGDLAYLIHGVHHDWPYDPDRLVMPPVVAVLLALVVGTPLRLALGPALFPGFFGGLVGGYLWYDLTHYSIHHLKPRTAFGKLQRRNHLVHHFADEPGRFGVTTPLWDHVFGTMPAVKKAAAQG